MAACEQGGGARAGQLRSEGARECSATHLNIASSRVEEERGLVEVGSGDRGELGELVLVGCCGGVGGSV